MPLAPRIGAAALLSSLLYAGALALTPIAGVLIVLVPLPGLMLATTAPAGACVLWLLLATAGVGAGLGVDAALGFVLPFGLAALAWAIGIRRHWSFERTALVGITVWGLSLAAAGIVVFGEPSSLAHSLRAEFGRAIDQGLSGTPQGVADERWGLAAADRAALAAAIVDVLPALMILGGMVTALGNLLLVRRMARIWPEFHFRTWGVPGATIWPFIVCGFGWFLPQPTAALVCENVFVVLLGAYLVQGIAIVTFWFERLRVTRALRVLIYVAIAAQPALLAAVLLLGIFDFWADFRRLLTASDAANATDGD